MPAAPAFSPERVMEALGRVSESEGVLNGTVDPKHFSPEACPSAFKYFQAATAALAGALWRVFFAPQGALCRKKIDSAAPAPYRSPQGTGPRRLLASAMVKSGVCIC
jgi:hypothetical protein